MAGAQVEIVADQIEAQRFGYMGLSLTNYDADTEPQIAAGSHVEVAGALFVFASAESITGWGSIGTSTDAYIKLVVAGTAITAEFTTTAPTWSTSKQGWYGTGGSALHRYVAKLYKDGSGNYTLKQLLAGASMLTRMTRWVFTTGTAATFTAPWSGRYLAKVYGGGGGGGGSSAGNGGGGGGAGGYSAHTYELLAGETLTYTVGAAGAAGSTAGGNGGSGGTSSVTDGSLATQATGGSGGQGASSGGIKTGGPGGLGTSSQAEVNIGGEDGDPNDGVSLSGFGGGAPGAARAAGVSYPGGGAGVAGSLYGGGGSGAGSATSLGGAGSVGAVIIEAV